MSKCSLFMMSSDVAGSDCVNMSSGINLFNSLWPSDAIC